MISRGYAALGVLVIPAALAAGIAGPASSGHSSPELPFTFVANHGQAPKVVRFVGNGSGFRARFRSDGFTVHQGGANVRVQFANGAEDPLVEAGDPMEATMNYLQGTNPAGWVRNLPLYRTLRYRGVWPGIEIRFRGEHARAKAEYIVEPGASIENIRLRFNGSASVSPDGSLIVRTESGEFREDRPYLFQDVSGRRIEVKGEFHVYADGSAGFTAEDWNHALPLVVDPTILFSGYLGGTAQTTITAMAVNSSYNTVVAGWTLSTDLGSGGAQLYNNGGVDAFVATFGPGGGNLLSCTYLGGSGDDRAFGLTVDSSNNIYVTGWTMSRNFPLAGALQTKLSGTRDAFVAKLNPAATALLFSTYLGGTGVDSGNGIQLTSTGSPIIIGNTTSANLPATAGAFQRVLKGGQDAFVAKLAPAGTSISMLTYFGGSANEHGAALSLDPTDTIVIVGSTFSQNFPVLNAMQPKSGGGQDAFLTRLTASGASLMFSTYLGGSGGSAGAPEQANCVVVSRAGKINLGGVTSSRNFPMLSDAAQAVFGGGLTDGFVLNFSLEGVLRRASFLGGSGDDGINALVTEPYGGYPVVGGYTTSSDFPVKNPVQAANAGGMDGFVVRTAYFAVTHGTYLGGTGNDSVNAVAVDSMFNFTAAGTTSSADLPVTGQLASFQGSTLSAFVTKISGSFALAAVAPPLFVLDVWHNTGFNGLGMPLTLASAVFGNVGDIPVAGDWSGSGVKRIGVFRNGTWILDTNGNGILDAADRTVVFGQAGDQPVVGDWNGTGRVKLGLFRQGTFILDLSGRLSGVPTGLSDAVFSFGQAGDLPVAGDWNDSGTTKVAVFRNGQWIVDYSGTHVSPVTWNFGQAGDKPVAGNWGGGGDSVGVFRGGAWILDYDRTHTITSIDMLFTFAGPGYLPLIW